MTHPFDISTPISPRDPLGAAFALALAAATSLGLARFSYALLLPEMRAALHWSYLTAGAMNTVNAAGYLLGALMAPRWFTRRDALQVLSLGGLTASIALGLHAFAGGDAALFALRMLAGLGSAASFIGGGLLAARLSHHASRPGLIVGLYYGGAGLGIVAATLIVPTLPWRDAWLALAAASLACTGATWFALRSSARVETAPESARAPRRGARWWPMRHALGGYLLFGFGYIGYMTFIVTLLREQGVVAAWIDAFYGLLGLGVVASSWLWAGLLQRTRGGGAIALLNGLLAFATLLPVLSTHPAVVAASCLLFGCSFLSVVASTTAFVRHNLPPAAWAGGIGAFTIVFAAGQILGPGLTGWLADGAGGLRHGFVGSAAALAFGALVAWRQPPLAAS